MISKAILSNKAHPVYRQATIPFPIPNSNYDRIITLLEAMNIGSPTGQDCQVDQLDSDYPVLNWLVTQSVNLDELDYLAKRLDVKDASQCTAVLDTEDICDAVRKVFEEEFKRNEHLDALNRLARCYQDFKDDEMEKFHTVFDRAWSQTPEEAA